MQQLRGGYGVGVRTNSRSFKAARQHTMVNQRHKNAIALIAITGGPGLLLILASTALSGSNEATLRGIGLTLLASPVVGIIVQWFQRDEVRKETRDAIGSAYAQTMSNGESLSQAGLVTVTPRVPRETLYNEFRSAKTKVRLLNTWIPGIEAVQRNLKMALEAGLKDVEILLADPFGPIARQRSHDLERGPLAVPQYIADNQRAIAKLIKAHPGKVRLRFYRGIPPFALYMADSSFFIGHYWPHKEGVEGPFVECSEVGFCANNIVDCWDIMWDRAYPEEHVSLMPPGQSHYNFQFLYYLSTKKDGFGVWRKVPIDVDDLVDQNKSSVASFASPDGLLVEYEVRAWNERNQLIVSMMGRLLEGTDCGQRASISDGIIVTFPLLSSIGIGGCLSGSMSHVDWTESPSIDPAFLLTGPYSREFCERNGIKEEDWPIGTENEEAHQALMKQWNAKTTLGTHLQSHLMKGHDQTP